MKVLVWSCVECTQVPSTKRTGASRNRSLSSQWGEGGSKGEYHRWEVRGFVGRL